jgi:phosphoserine phosphatase
VVFDVEGVLVPKHRYLLFEMGRMLGFTQFLMVAFYGVLYELGLVSVKHALEGVCRAFRGFRVDMLLDVFKAVPLITGVEEVFKIIRERGWKIALISSGLPDFVVQDLARRLGADYAVGFNLEVEDGIVAGRVSGDVLEPHGKLVVLRRILEIEGLNPRDCIVIADDRNNAPMMLSEALKIGFHPDFMVRIKADHVVTGSLMEILPLMGIVEPRAGASLSGNEVIRECIHGSAHFGCGSFVFHF